MARPLIALTGATGFIGRQLLQELREHGYRVRILLRRPVDQMPDTDSAVIGDLRRPINLSRALEDVEVVVHSAALAHRMSGQPEEDFRAINTDATIALAKAARRAGARRFVLLSSVRAQSGPSCKHALKEDMPASPTDDYGRSKLAAERGLEEVGLEWVALRSALVYGNGVQGNMAQLLQIARSHWPVPLPYPSGRRSLLALDNLAEAVRAVINAQQVASGPYLVSDDKALNVFEMIEALRNGSRFRSVTVPIPAGWFRTFSNSLGYADVFERLSADLIVDNSRLKKLGWRPRVDTREGLERLARSQP